MNVYPEEIADPEKPAKISSKMPEQTAGVADSSDTNRRGKRVLTAALLSSVALAMGLGIWSLSRQLAPELPAVSVAGGRRPRRPPGEKYRGSSLGES